MPRLLFAITTTLCCATVSAKKAHASTNVASQFRAIIKEPMSEMAVAVVP